MEIRPPVKFDEVGLVSAYNVQIFLEIEPNSEEDMSEKHANLYFPSIQYEDFR